MAEPAPHWPGRALGPKPPSHWRRRGWQVKSPCRLAEGWVSNLNVDFTRFKVPAAPCPLLPAGSARPAAPCPPPGAPRVPLGQGTQAAVKQLNSRVRRTRRLWVPCTGAGEVSFCRAVVTMTCQSCKPRGRGKSWGLGLLSSLAFFFLPYTVVKCSRTVKCLGQGLHLEIMSWE